MGLNPAREFGFFHLILSLSLAYGMSVVLHMSQLVPEAHLRSFFTRNMGASVAEWLELLT